MSLPDGPPNRSGQRGSQSRQFRYIRGGTKFHTIKESSDKGKGTDFTLKSLRQLWTNGFTAKGASTPLVPGVQLRWQTVKLLRVLLYKFTTTQQVPINTIPAQFHTVWNKGRLSQVGIEIGSSIILTTHKKHLDIDWFGPAGQTANHSWWRPIYDGHLAEVTCTRGLLHYLEASLGLQASGDDPGGWSWPTTPTKNGPLAALNDPAIDAAVLSLAASSGFDDIRLVWQVGDQHSPPPVVSAVSTAIVGHDLVIDTPDVSGANPN